MILRKYTLKDLERHLELFLMNDITKVIDDKVRKQEKSWLKKVIANYKKNNPEFYALAIILNKKLIGNCIAEKFDLNNKTLEIGFWIGKDYWNKGNTTKALKIFLKEIVKKFKVKKVYAHCRKNNVASTRVLEKVGFVFINEKKGMKIFCKEIRN